MFTGLPPSTCFDVFAAPSRFPLEATLSREQYPSPTLVLSLSSALDPPAASAELPAELRYCVCSNAFRHGPPNLTTTSPPSPPHAIRRTRTALRPHTTRVPICAGPPGCGKGTQSARLKRDYCVCHLSTGDLLRAAVRNKTPMGVKAKRAMDSGALVDDEIVTGIVADNLKSVKCSKGFILDGFPRNLVQAEKV